MFFCSNAGSPLGFSGRDNSNKVFKINLAQTLDDSFWDKVSFDHESSEWVVAGGNLTDLEEISGADGRNGHLVNVNGGTNFQGQGSVSFRLQGRKRVTHLDIVCIRQSHLCDRGPQGPPTRRTHPREPKPSLQLIR